LTPRKLRCFEAVDAGESSRDSVPTASPLLSESCVVALEMSCGLDGAFRMEWDVEGLELRNPSCGRGGSGGGVPSLDGAATLLVEALRDMLFVMFNVGFAKSCCATLLSAFLKEALLLLCLGVEGALWEGKDAPSGPALPVSGIKTVVTVPHQGSV